MYTLFATALVATNLVYNLSTSTLLSPPACALETYLHPAPVRLEHLASAAALKRQRW
jgi:hypothetical protein